jgi:hypothetical protein
MLAVRDPATGARRERLRRGLTAACLVGVAATHIADVPEHATSAPYLAALFIALAATSLVLATVLLVRRADPLAWAAGARLSLLVICGYVLSRTVGLPKLRDHVGHWGEPAGIAALVFEGAVIALAVARPSPVGDQKRWMATLTVGLLGICVGGLIEETRMRGTASFDHAHAHGAGSGSVSHAHIDGGRTAAHRHGPAGTSHGRMDHNPRFGHGRLQMTDSGRIRFTMQRLRVENTTSNERRAAASLLRRAQTAARRLFPTLPVALARGYAIDPQRPPGNRTILRPHLTQWPYLHDGATLDPDRPESLVYQRIHGHLKLVAFMFRERTRPLHSPAGRYLRWHLHGGCVRPDRQRPGIDSADARCPNGTVLHYGKTMMLHLWLAKDLRTAFSLNPPPGLRQSR